MLYLFITIGYQECYVNPVSGLVKLYRGDQFYFGGRIPRTQRKPPTCRTSLTNTSPRFHYQFCFLIVLFFFLDQHFARKYVYTLSDYILLLHCFLFGWCNDMNLITSVLFMLICAASMM